MVDVTTVVVIVSNLPLSERGTVIVLVTKVSRGSPVDADGERVANVRVDDPGSVRPNVLEISRGVLLGTAMPWLPLDVNVKPAELELPG